MTSSTTPNRHLHLIGYGSQAKAWSAILRDTGYSVSIALRGPESASWSQAITDGFDPITLEQCREVVLSRSSSTIAFLCPDHIIGSLYQKYFAEIPRELTLVLAHGYAVYSGELITRNALHQIALLAPKSIGPQLRAAFLSAKEKGRPFHDRTAAISEQTPSDLTSALGFSKENLVLTNPETEAVGDLLSEQGLLCGGLFTMIDWTISSMRAANIPDRLIQEECVTELLLIAGLIQERGLETTLRSISQAALAGASLMNESLESSGARKAFDERLSRVLTKNFVQDYKSDSWKTNAAALFEKMKNYESQRKDRS